MGSFQDQLMGVFAKYDPKMDDNGKWAVRVENHDDENHAKTAISDDEIKATALGSKTDTTMAAESTAASTTTFVPQNSYSRSSSSSTLFETTTTATTSAEPQLHPPAAVTTTETITATPNIATEGGITPPAQVAKQPVGSQREKNYFTTVFKDESGNKATLLIRNREIWLGNQARVHMIYTVSAISSAIIFAILITDIVREAVDTHGVTRDGHCFRDFGAVLSTNLATGSMKATCGTVLLGAASCLVLTTLEEQESIIHSNDSCREE
ncbi:hypothetical protein RRG08_040704 [Elysia crispata]|uniref:Uncharacterized protein n=1 Tax=Elysia crispata TaxID=231223 RepID=A0AAE1AXN6_9GAST|nr:hypothetical protein RRG08_040704 [Elysia crispata]